MPQVLPLSFPGAGDESFITWRGNATLSSSTSTPSSPFERSGGQAPLGACTRGHVGATCSEIDLSHGSHAPYALLH